MVVSFERPALLEAFRKEQQRNDKKKDAHGNRGAERPVVGRAEKRLHDVSDHGARRSADEQRSKEITQGKYERKRSARQQARHGQRKNHAKERGERAGAEVVRSLHERARNVFKRSVDGQEDERRV